MIILDSRPKLKDILKDQGFEIYLDEETVEFMFAEASDVTLKNIQVIFLN